MQSVAALAMRYKAGWYVPPPHHAWAGAVRGLQMSTAVELAAIHTFAPPPPQTTNLRRIGRDYPDLCCTKLMAWAFSHSLRSIPHVYVPKSTRAGRHELVKVI